MKPFKILWLGFAIPDETAREIFSIDPMPAVQTHKFGWSFVRALERVFGEVTLASSCPVQNFPIARRLFFRGGSFFVQSSQGILLGFINLLVLKHLTRFVSILISLPPVLYRKKIDWIFVHGVHTPYLLFGLLSRLVGFRVLVVLTDSPGILLSTDSRLARLLKVLDVLIVKTILKNIDAVIALAPGLACRLAPGRPALVFPGILESRLDRLSRSPSQSCEILSGNLHPFTVVYAGGLSAAYGVDRLIKAVQGFDNASSIRLKLFGRGDQEDVIRYLSLHDARFVYGGFVDADTLWPELCSADLLINPRPTSEFFAALSFPSKLIEYLSAGRPVLTTRIPSLPEDLKPHYLYIDDESPEGIRAALENVMQMPESIRLDFALSAKCFAQANFSEEASGRKIAHFIESLS